MLVSHIGNYKTPWNYWPNVTIFLLRRVKFPKRGPASAFIADVDLQLFSPYFSVREMIFRRSEQKMAVTNVNNVPAPTLVSFFFSPPSPSFSPVLATAPLFCVGNIVFYIPVYYLSWQPLTMPLSDEIFRNFISGDGWGRAREGVDKTFHCCRFLLRSDRHWRFYRWRPRQVESFVLPQPRKLEVFK